MSLAAHGADVFRWIDENGKIHYGETVPERYKQKTKKLEGADVTSAQREEAQARTAREQARAESLRRAREAKSEGSQSVAAQSPEPSADVPPADNKANECQEQLKKYLDSQTCFAPYVIKGGAVRPEAFEHCTEVKQPRGCWQKPSSSDRN